MAFSMRNFRDGLKLAFSGQQKAVNQAWSTDASIWFQSGVDPQGPGRSAGSSPVEAAISLISNDISTLTPRLLDERPNGTIEVITNSPIARVLARPNDYMTRTDLFRQVVRDVLLYGNFYAWIDRDARNQPVAIYPLRSKSATPMILADGSVVYSIQLTELERGERAMQSMMVPSSDIIHHRMLTSAHPLIGVSPLYAIGGTSSLNQALVDNMARFHANNSRPGGILSVPGGLKPESRERLKAEFSRSFGGQNAGKTAVLDFETKYEQLGYSAEQSQVTDLLKFSVEDVCRALKIPPYMMGLQTVGQASVEHATRMYYSQCLRVWLEALEDRLDVFFGMTGTTRRIEFNIDELFRAESDRRIDSLSTAVQGGIMTPNEARRSERLGPVEGGDMAFLQRQMTPVNLLTQLAAVELDTKEDVEDAAPTEDVDEESDDSGEKAVYEMIMKAVGNHGDNRRIDFADAIRKEMGHHVR